MTAQKIETIVRRKLVETKNWFDETHGRARSRGYMRMRAREALLEEILKEVES